MFGLGFQEIIIILVVALLVIGPRKLPDLAKSLGKAFREFKHAADDIKQNFDLDALADDDRPAAPKPATHPEEKAQKPDDATTA